MKIKKMSEVLAKDIFDKEIRKGDMIAYPVRHASSLWMSYGYVIEARTKRNYWRDDAVTVLVIEGGSTESKRIISKLDRIVRVDGKGKII